MKKTILLALVSSAFFLAGCGPEVTSDSGSASNSEPSVNVVFYSDYNNTKTPYKSATYPVNSKIERPTDPSAPDPAYPDFVGWSTKTQITDETELWNFDTVVSEAKDITLYGNWTKKDDGGGGDEPSTELTLYTFMHEKWTGTSLYAYVFNSLEEGVFNATWPGEVMSLSGESTWLYEYKVDTAIYDSIIFNDGTKQTADLSLSDASEESPFYNVYTKEWTAVPSEKPTYVSTDKTYTINSLPEWIQKDECVIFVWAWGGEAGNGDWYSTSYTDKTTLTFEAPSDITGCLLVRCVAGTTTPNWKQTGDDPGRIYNQTENISEIEDVMTSPEWKEYVPPVQ